MIDAKIKIHCTDNGKDLEVHVLNYKPKAYKENTQVFFGNVGGREFVVREDSLPTPRKEFRR